MRDSQVPGSHSSTGRGGSCPERPVRDAQSTVPGRPYHLALALLFFSSPVWLPPRAWPEQAHVAAWPSWGHEDPLFYSSPAPLSLGLVDEADPPVSRAESEAGIWDLSRAFPIWLCLVNW